MKIKTKLLIVEDDLYIIEIYKNIFNSSKSYIYEIAKNGIEALKLIPVFLPDIIILDVLMPDINGYEVCKEIRKNNLYKYTKILMVSGKRSLEERLKGYDAGADDYITKPFEQEEFLAKLKVYRQLKRLEEVIQIQHNMLTILSHEIRTPLNGIIGAAEIIQITDNSSNKEMIDILVKSSNDIQKLVDNVFLFCNLKNGIKMDLTKIFILNDLKTLLHDFEYKYIDKNIKIINSCKKNIFIYADIKYFQIAFSNLIDNAAKFSKEGGIVKIFCDVEDDYVVIKIKDNGKGIKNTQINNIFNAFAIDDVLNHHQGLGINLAITKLIIEQHNGYLSVESDSGKGATFICKFPCNYDESESNNEIIS